MKKIHIIESILGFLASDAAGDSKGIYHPEEIKNHLNNVFNDIIYNTWVNGKKNSDFSQLEAWSKTYECAIVGQAYALLPFAPIQLPNGDGVRQVCDHDVNAVVFAPVESTSNPIFAELEVNDMDDTPTYNIEQNTHNVGAGEASHMLKLGKLPIAPDTLIGILDVLMVVPMDQIDDYDDIALPSGLSDSLVRQVIDLMSKKPLPDVSNDMVNEVKR